MKRTLAGLMAAAALAMMFSLAGCGANGGRAGDNHTDNTNETSLTDEVTGAVGRALRGDTTRHAVDGTNHTYTAMNNGGVAQRGEKAAEAAGDRYALMLENGRVHDRDGFILDGENAHNKTY